MFPRVPHTWLDTWVGTAQRPCTCCPSVCVSAQAIYGVHHAGQGGAKYQWEQGSLEGLHHTPWQSWGVKSRVGADLVCWENLEQASLFCLFPSFLSSTGSACITAPWKHPGRKPLSPWQLALSTIICKSASVQEGSREECLATAKDLLQSPGFGASSVCHSLHPGPRAQRNVHHRVKLCYLYPRCPWADHYPRAATTDLEFPPSCPLPNSQNLPREPSPTPQSSLPGVSWI